MRDAGWGFRWGIAAVLALAAGCGGGNDGGDDDDEGMDAGQDDDDDDDDDGDDDDDDDDDDGIDAACGEGVSATAAPIRRMTDRQYRNTIEDLFEGALTPSDAFPATATSVPYASYPEANLVSQLGAEEIMLAAEEVGAQAVDNLSGVLPCDPAPSEDTCVDEFIEDFGRRAFRRPLRDEERAVLRSVFDDARSQGELADAIGLVITAALQMPQFLYFIEEGEGPDDEGVVALTGYEVATRLSYLLWDTMPDDALLDAAQDGELASLAGIEAQARRLLDDERAAQVVTRFSRQWLHVGELSTAAKDLEFYPSYDDTLIAAMEEELARFVEKAYWSGEGSLQALMVGTTTEVNAPLAAHYGISSSSTGPDDWTEVELPADRRAGILTLPAVIASNSSSVATNVILRGEMLRTQVLCQEMPPAPMNIEVPDFPENATERDKTEALLGEATCSGCHALMNPLGLGFEHYDAIGAWREQDRFGNSVDASGEVVGGPAGVEGEFEGAVELAQMLGNADSTGTCLTRQWLRYTYGRSETPDDSCLVESLADHFAESGHDLQELLIGFTQSDGFRFRQIEQGA